MPSSGGESERGNSVLMIGHRPPYPGVRLLCYDGRTMVTFDLPGGIVELRNEDVFRLRDAAAADAGRSSTARDLSLLLDRALRGHRVALRRGELEALVAVAQATGEDDVAHRLREAAAGGTELRGNA